MTAKLPGRLFLAPMAGITDRAYRVLARELGAEVCVTELISSEGYVHGSRRTKEMMQLLDEEQPAGIQIFGARPEAMADCARFAQDCGAAFVDINCGCPVPKVVKSGAGSALMRDLPLLEKILSAMRKAIDIPLSLKIRTGWSGHEIVAGQIARLAADSGADWIAIHGRTKAQGYSGFADWDLIEQTAKVSPIPVIGNGDLCEGRQVADRLQKGSCSAVMIGRSVLTKPLLFIESLNCLGGKRQVPSYTDILKRMSELYNRHAHSKVRAVQFRKMLVYLATGIPGKGPFRQKLFEHQADMKCLLEEGLEFFREENLAKQQRELNFLPGGHG